MSDYIDVAGFGDTEVNGRYFYQGDRNGYPYYRKNANVFMRYCESYGPYCFTPAYYIEKIYRVPGAVPIIAGVYRVLGNDPASPNWTSLVGSETVEAGTGGADEGEFSSESSSSKSSISESSVSSSSSSIDSSSSLGNTSAGFSSSSSSGV